MKNWLIFVLERFSPAVYIPTIGVLCLSLFSLGSFEVSVKEVSGLFLFLSLFLFKLRVYDEIKDYDTDLVLNPTRPLPRGLLSVSQAKKMFVTCIVLEVLLFVVFQKLAAIPTLLIAILYSLLMYKEFFIGEVLRHKLTTYAVMHTFVITLITLSGYSFLQEKPFYALDSSFYVFALLNWPIFNFFEFARKTFTHEEEQLEADSYSSLFKPTGAFLLSFSQVVALVFLVKYFEVLSLPGIIMICLISSLFVFSGLYYCFTSSMGRGKVFRATSSLSLLLLYVALSYELIAGVFL